MMPHWSDLPFTQFRADLFTALHSVSDVFSVIFNGTLLYLIIFHTSKSFRSYSVILGSLALSEFLLGWSAGVAMTRCIPIGWGLAYQFHGVCRKISPQFCMNVHAITAGSASYNYSLLFVSFWYRHYVLTKHTPKAWWIGLLCCVFYIPSLASVITFAASTSTTDATRELLVAGRNISLFPDDPNIAAMLGYESIFQGTTMVLIVWILFPVFPGYCLSIYYRTKIMHILNDNTSAMSNSTKRAQHDLIKALTIQAVLPVVMMSQCSVYFWRQFQLPFGDKAPYFEEAPFLLLAMVSAFSPAITIYYLLPYRKRVVEIVIFWKKFARTRIYDHSTHSTTKEKHSNGTIHINSMF